MGHPALKTIALPAGNLLFVDADDLLIEMIENGFSLSRPRWSMIISRHPAEALEVLSMHSDLDAIVTELVFDRSPEIGRVFIQEVAHRWPEIPIFAMTRLESTEAGELDTAEYIAKPPDIDFLIGRIDRAIRRRKESQIRGIPLSTFLQILEIEKKTCTVVVSSRGQVGEISFRNGHIQHARLGTGEGKEALFAMLSMSDHLLRIVDRYEARGSMGASLASLLMEWSVRADHLRRQLAISPEETQ